MPFLDVWYIGCILFADDNKDFGLLVWPWRQKNQGKKIKSYSALLNVHL